MKKFLNRTLGIALIIAAIAGLVFNLAGVIVLWRYKQTITDSFVSTVTGVNTTMETTLYALDVAQQSLETSRDSVIAIQGTIDATADTIETSGPMIDTLAEMMTEDLPDTITAARTSLVSAQESARLIDTFLRALTQIPFVSDNLYNPPVPLHIALEQVSNNLSGLPASFLSMGESLTTASTNLNGMQTEVALISTNIDTINTNLKNANTVLSQYRIQVSTLQGQMEQAAQAAPGFINTAAWVLTFFFVWLAVTQIGLLFQGMEMLGYKLLGDEQGL